MIHYENLEKIINQIRQADEQEILEFDFEPCFALMLDIALKLTKVSVDNFYLMQNMGAEYLLEHSPETAKTIAEIEAQAVERFAKLASRRMGNMTWIIELARAENVGRKLRQRTNKEK